MLLKPYSVHDSKVRYLIFQLPWYLIAFGHLLTNEENEILHFSTSPYEQNWEL